MKPLSDYKRDFLFHLSRRVNHPLVPPDWLSVNLTLKCNLTCVMCTTCYDSPEMTTAEILSIIDQAADWGIRIFNPLGGEPFIRKDIITILEHAQNRGMWITVTTNGTVLTAEKARDLARLTKVHMNVSIDGLEEACDFVRGPGVFAKAANTIRTVRGYERELIAAQPELFPKRINVNSIIHDKSFTQLLEFVEFVKSLGADKIQFLHLFDPGEKKGDPRVAGMWIPRSKTQEFDRAIDELCDYIKNDRSGFGYVNSVADLQMFKEYYRGGLKPHNAPCYNGFKEFYINADGAGLMCDGKLDFLAQTFGNARTTPIKDMWLSEQARRMREKVIGCTTPCVQNCYLRRDSDDVAGIAAGAARALALEIRDKFAATSSGQRFRQRLRVLNVN